VCCDAGRIRRTLRGDAVTAGAPDLRVPRGRGASSGTKDPVGGVDCSCLWAGNPGHFILGEQVLIEKITAFRRVGLRRIQRAMQALLGGGVNDAPALVVAGVGRGWTRADVNAAAHQHLLVIGKKIADP
jgi:hypothetical protein